MGTGVLPELHPGSRGSAGLKLEKIDTRKVFR